MLAQRDDNHHTVYKVRRCFLWQQTYFQLDIYKVPCHSRCFGLILLETYTTLSADELKCKLPPFLNVVREVSNEADFSMYNLSMKLPEPGTPPTPAATPATFTNGSRRKSSTNGTTPTSSTSGCKPPAAVNGKYAAMTNGQAKTALMNGNHCKTNGDIVNGNGNHFVSDENDTNSDE